MAPTTMWGMGTRTTRTMRGFDLRHLPDTCLTCPMEGKTVDPDAAWVQAALRRYGFFGIGVWDDDALIAYALIAPTSHVPRAHPLSRHAGPAHAVLIRTDVVGDSKGDGCARHLMTTLLGRLASIPAVTAVEASGFDGRGTCVTPSLSWLTSVGFRPHGASTAPGHPMILELSRTVRLRRRLAGAPARVRGAVPVLGKPPAAEGGRGLRRVDQD